VIPVASDIKICGRIRHYFPSHTGDASGQRLASPLHGTLTPGRFSVGRPPAFRRDWTGVSLSLTLSSQHQPPQLASWADGPAPHLILAVIDRNRLGGKSNRTEKGDFVSSPRFYRWSSRILQRRLPLSGTRQESIQNIGYEIFKEQWKGKLLSHY